MKVKVLIISLIFAILILNPLKIYADSATQTAIGKGINYLGTQLNGATGQITGGSTGDASPWAAIAFSANGIVPSTVKTSTSAPSLMDYLQTNHPTTSSAATEWEKWILAITASGQNPYDFGGINYVNTLESSTYYNNNQIGDTTSVTDDWFGVLALISSGVSNSDPVLTNSLSFILAHQNTDGGFGYSTTAGSDGNDTAAAIQALVAAQNDGVANANLATATANAKTYVLKTQDTSGGFLYDTNPWTTAPDSDSTTWALMALNLLGMQDSDQAGHAKTWLFSQQSTTDGGFTSCNQWDPNTFACTGYASNSTTTSHALIGLAGKGWIINIFHPSAGSGSSTPTPTDTPFPTITINPTPTATQNTNDPNSTSTPIPTVTPTPSTLSAGTGSATPTPTTDSGSPTPTTDSASSTPTPQEFAAVADSPTPSTIASAQTAEVLGAKTEKGNTTTGFTLQFAFMCTFLGLGVVSLGFYGFQKLKKA